MARIADRAAVDRNGAGLDQRLEPAARKFADMAGERAIEPLAALRRPRATIDFCVMVSVMPNLSDNASEETGSSKDLTAAVARVRWLMIISGLTTAIAIAAVVGVIGYRVFSRGGSGAATISNGTVFLPKGAHVDSTTVSDGRIVVTLDVGGSSEVRIFDLKTLQLVGQLHFTTER